MGNEKNLPAIVFICTGNVCRSPMAEYLLRKRLGGDQEWRIESAGLAAGNGFPASEAAAAVMAEDENIDLTPHRSRMLTPGMVDAASLIVCMTPAHRTEILRRFPAASEKTFVLTDFSSEADQGGIPDPIGRSVQVYRDIKNRIDSALSDLILYMRDLR